MNGTVTIDTNGAVTKHGMETKLDIDPCKLTKEVLRLAKESPNYVYPSIQDGISVPSCYYTKGATPECKGCIFGVALQNLGVSKERLEEFGQSAIHYLIEANTKLLEVFVTVQVMQDNGEPWGEAVKPLKEYLKTNIIDK